MNYKEQERLNRADIVTQEYLEKDIIIYNQIVKRVHNGGELSQGDVDFMRQVETAKAIDILFNYKSSYNIE